MIPIILTTHGEFGSALIESSEMLVGKSEKLYAITLSSGESFDDFQQRLFQKVEEVAEDDGVLILADILGGSPYNASAVCLGHYKTECLTGLNMSMLLTALDQRDFCDLAHLAQECREAALSNIVNIREQLAAVTDEDDE